MSTDPHVFLAGRPSLKEYVAVLRRALEDAALVRGEPAPDSAGLADEWRRASDHIKTLERSEAGIADRPDSEPLPDELAEYARAWQADPAFQCCYAGLRTEFRLVELDRLVVFQKYLNLTHSDGVRGDLGPSPGPRSVAEAALGCGDRRTPPVRCHQGNGELFAFASPSKDFRVLDAKVIAGGDPSAPCRGRAAASIVIRVGYSVNCVTVMRAGGRFILCNGSHRAYALRSLGLARVPCLVVQAERPEDMELIVGGEAGFRPEIHCQSPRPPLLRDYFDPRLSRTVPVLRTNRLVRVHVRFDQLDVPAASPG